LLDVIRAVLRDVMLASTGLDPAELPHARYAQELTAMSERVDPLAVAGVLQDIDRVEQDLVYNPNPRVTMEACLVSAAAQLRQ